MGQFQKLEQESGMLFGSKYIEIEFLITNYFHLHSHLHGGGSSTKNLLVYSTISSTHIQCV